MNGKKSYPEKPPHRASNGTPHSLLRVGGNGMNEGTVFFVSGTGLCVPFEGHRVPFYETLDHILNFRQMFSDLFLKHIRCIKPHLRSQYARVSGHEMIDLNPVELSLRYSKVAVGSYLSISIRTR